MHFTELSIIISAATPLLLAALGELVVEKSGVLNLGIEGMMLTGAVVGFIAAISGFSPWSSLFFAATASAVLASLFAFMVLILRTNQVATGLALAIFGGGLSKLIGSNYVGENYAGIGTYPIPFLSDIPEIGPILFNQDILTYFSIISLFLVLYFLNKTKSGLILRSIGENHQAAYSLGYHVIRTRFLAILFGGAMAGLAGAYMSLVTPHLWTDNLINGRGWIALALVVFAAWRPIRLLLGAYLFGSISILQYSFQSGSFALPAQFWVMLPYLVTVITLIIISKNSGNNLYAPRDLGKPFITH